MDISICLNNDPRLTLTIALFTEKTGEKKRIYTDLLILLRLYRQHVGVFVLLLRGGENRRTQKNPPTLDG